LRRPVPDKIEELDGVMKSAVLLLSLRADAASAMLKDMPSETVEEVTRVLAQLGEVPPGLGEQVVEDFYRAMLESQNTKEGDLGYASMLLRESLPRDVADKVIGQIEARVQRTPFAFLQKAGIDNLLTFIQDEHPQTISLILSYLPHKKSSEVLDALPVKKQIEVARRMAHMEQTNPEVIRQIESGLAVRLSNLILPAMEKVGGVESLAEVLNLCERGTEKSILEGIETDDPDLVDEIRRLMFVFEDILLVDDKGIQAALKAGEDLHQHVGAGVRADQGRDAVHGPGAAQRRRGGAAADRGHRAAARGRRRHHHCGPGRGQGHDRLRC
jgi:flagellar motor switch protein FliG